MPKDETAADRGPNGRTNLTVVKDQVAQGVKKIKDAKLQRKKANEQIAAVRSDLETYGIPKKALATAMAYVELNPEDREGFDLAYEIVRETLGYPVNAQGELFTREERDQMREARKKEAAAKEGTDAEEADDAED